MKLLLNRDGLVVGKSDTYQKTENGIIMNDVLHTDTTLTIVEVDPSTPVEIMQHYYLDGVIRRNLSYVKTPRPEYILLQDVKTRKEIFDETNLSITDIDTVKRLKIDCLKEACENAIYQGFHSESVGESFGFNPNDQMNFTQLSLRILTYGKTYDKPIMWKTLSGEVKLISLEQFNKLLDEAEDHKIANQTKYWQLESLVKKSSDIEEIAHIEWDSQVNE